MANFTLDIFGQVERSDLRRDEALDLLRQYRRSGCVDATGVVRWLHTRLPGVGLHSGSGARAVLICALTGREFFLADHRIDGVRVLPAAAYFEFVRAAVRHAGMMPSDGFVLKHVSLERPLPLDGDGDGDEAHLLVVELLADARGRIGFTLASTALPLAEAAPRLDTTAPGALATVAELTVHCMGVYLPAPAPALASADPLAASERSSGLTGFDAETCYRFMAARGFEYGPRQRALQQVALQSDDCLYADLVLPASLASSLPGMLLHPSLLDGALQAAVGFHLADADAAGTQAGLPFAVEEISVWRACESRMRARVTRHAIDAGSVSRVDVDLYGAGGRLCVSLKGLTSRARRTHASHDDALLLAQPVWRSVPLALRTGRERQPGAHRIVLVGDLGAGAHTGEALVAALNARWPAGLPRPEVVRIDSEAVAHGGDPIAGSLSLKHCLQECVATPSRESERLLLAIDDASALAHSAHALLKCVAAEYPQRQPKLVSWARPATVDEIADALVGEALAGDSADCVRYASEREVKLWKPLAGDAPAPAHAWRDGGAYLISGGAGHLGLDFARDIAVSVAAPRIFLLGRSDPAMLDERQQQRLCEIRDAGAQVVQYRVDVADADALRDVVVQIEREHGPLHGVLHAAGVIGDGLLVNKTDAEWERVLRPKVLGAANLDRATRHMALDCFVLFSSGSAVFGNAGQSDYAVANAYLGWYAERRQADVDRGAAHGRSLCIHWPLWDGGMADATFDADQLYRATGMRPMRAALGIEAFCRGLVAPCTELIAAAGDRDRLERHLPGADRADAQQDEGTLGAAAVQPRRATDAERVPDTPQADAATRHAAAARLLQRVVAAALKLSADQLRTDQPLDQYGIDSVDMMKATRELEKTFGALPKTLFFQYPTIDELAAYFADRHAGPLTAMVAPITPAASAQAPVQAPAKQEIEAVGARRAAHPGTTTDLPDAAQRDRPGALPSFGDPEVDIAIIGLSGRYPRATDIAAFWDNLAGGVDAVGEIPAQRWDWNAYYRDSDGHRPGAHASKWGGFIDGVDEFDPLFFNISPSEAEIMDPQERLFLQHAWAALEDAGYCRSRLARARRARDTAGPGETGVYVGVMYSEYIQCADNDPERLVGSSYASIANRVSYALDLRGPSLAIDTMCSSSLTCLHLACRELASGDIAMALVGGVNLNLHPNKYHLLSQGRFVSPRGRCHSFGADGDGYVPSEGVGVICVKRFADAERDGDPIYAVIRGSSINHGGKSQGYSVPQPQRQQDVIRRALKHARVDARSVSYIEAHGTGTSLGDPIEIAGLSGVFARDTGDTQFCAIGSVKSNIGHCEAAAGMSALTKVIGQMRAGELFPSLHAQRLNPHIDFAASPFSVVQQRQPWAVSGERRIAGISSFGAGGSNAHIVLQDYPLPAADSDAGEPCLVPLSARTSEQLTLQARALAAYLADCAQARAGGQPRSAKDWLRPPAGLASIAYTLQTGREPWEARVAFIADSRDELLGLLNRYLDGRPDEHRTFAGTRANGNRLLPLLGADQDSHALIDVWFKKRKYTQLLTAWVEGIDLDWEHLYRDDAGATGRRPRRANLPTYPFAKERYWLPSAGADVPQPATPDRASTARLGYRVPAWERLPSAASSEEAGSGRVTDVLLCGWDANAARRLMSQWPAGHCRVAAGGDIADSVDGDFTRSALSLFAELQRLLPDSSGAAVRVQVLVPSGGRGDLLTALEAMLCSLAFEQPAFAGQLIQCDDAPSDDAARGVREQAETAARHLRASLIRCRDGVLSRRVWRDAAVAGAVEPQWRERGVYLITGGGGALGSLLARRLARAMPSVVLILTGRRAQSGRADTPVGTLLDEMRGQGITIEYRAADIADPAACEQLVTDIEREHGALHGVFHAAGVTRDGVALCKTPDTLRAVFAPKVAGTVNLDLATRHLPLDFFVLYSSLSGAMGNAGQSDYATANAFMDRYAAYRDALVATGERRGRTVSIGWPWWESEGMAPDAHAARLLREQTGMLPLPADDGMHALTCALAHSGEHLLVVFGDAQRIREAAEAAEHGQPAPARPATGDAIPPPSASGIDERVTDRLREMLGRLCKLSPQRIDPLAQIESYGIDSVRIRHLQQSLGEHYPGIGTAVLYEHTTLASLATHLVAQYPAESRTWAGVHATVATATPAIDATAERTPTPVADARGIGDNGRTNDDSLVAIIGIAGRYPKAANLDEYWRNLVAGVDCIGEIPAERWPLEGFYVGDKDEASRTGRSYSKWGGFIDGFADFDPQFFSIAPRDAYLMDPQERLFLQCAWEALEDAGYSREALARHRDRAGVFVGATKTGFELYGPEFWRQDKAFLPRTSFGSIANRVSYCLDLAGPSLAIDTMCSSSLVSIHEACEYLRRGGCDIAIAGGVNLYLHPANYVSLCSGHMLSGAGRCRSFGAGADGFVPGEGVGAVILKPLAHARRDGDTIHAVIRASGINHSGKTHGYMVPSPASQQALIRQTLAKADCDAVSISYLEAHGTGTALGDPIEFRGLVQAFGGERGDGAQCALGSVKSNIGHLEAAAGIAALTKVVLQLRHRTLVPTLHARELNPEIALAGSGFYLSDTLRDWTAQSGTDTPLRSGISSFGAGGVNAHLIVEQYRDADAALDTSAGSQETPAMFVLSARNADRLDAYLDRIIDFLAKGGGPLAELCCVLQTGRTAMPERCAFVCRSTSELLDALRAHRRGEHVDGFHRGRITGVPAAGEPEAPLAPGDLDACVGAWVRGAALDWRALRALPHGARPARAIAVPTYPFKRQRFWLDTLPPALALDARDGAATSAIADGGAMGPTSPRNSVSVGDAREATGSGAIRLPAPRAFVASRRYTVAMPITLAAPAARANARLSAASESAPATRLPAAEPPRASYPGEPLVPLRDSAHPTRVHVALPAGCDAMRLVTQLTALFEQPAGGDPIDVVVLHGPPDGLRQSLDGVSDGAATRLVDAIGRSSSVVLAAFHGDAIELGWVIGAASDLLIVDIDGRYGCPSAPRRAIDGALRARFGARPGAAAMLSGEVRTGAAWQAENLGILALPAHAIAAQALTTTEALVGGGGRAGGLLKAHWRTTFLGEDGALGNVSSWPLLADRAHAPDVATVGPDATDLGSPVPLPHPCVELTFNALGVATARLNQVASKNAFTPELVAAMEAVVAWAGATPACKVLILTGYGHYFATGGTLQGLKAIQQGNAKFTDARLYELPLACPVPVIAAMQGHAIGAGWSMGMMCDAVLFAEESVYHSPYLSYGFTPGAGSTLVFPMRLGLDLGREILLGAQPYKGRELRERLPGLSVVPRGEVLALAHRIATRWATPQTREELIRAKQLRLAPLVQGLPETIQKELAMHEKTFYHNPAVAALIDRSFGLGAARTGDAPGANAAAARARSLETLLKSTLAAEIQLAVEELDDQASFVDLGLDSVTAVTWTRTICRALSVELSPAHVYEYPSVARLLAYLLDITSGGLVQHPVPADARAESPVLPVPTPAPAERTIADIVMQTLAAELQLDAQDIDAQASFVDLGLDSVTAVTWARKLHEQLSVELSPTQLYQYPNVATLSAYLGSAGASLRVAQPAATNVASALPPASVTLHGSKPGEPAVGVSAVVPASREATLSSAATTSVPAPAPARSPGEPESRKRVDIAIIGMAGRFPGATDLDAFWRNLVEGRDSIVEVPAHRWSLDGYYDPNPQAKGKTYSRWIGLLDDADAFDAEFFGISPREAEHMDPQQRVFMENCWHAIEHAGYNPFSLATKHTGVFVGCATGDYADLGERNEAGAQSFMGGASSILSARMPYFLNLDGPCLAIDTACSSALVAVNEACNSLLLGNCDLAIAGGVCVMAGPTLHILSSKAGMLSPTGRCRTFDDAADGFVPGEGVGTVLLRRLDDAIAAGDTIHGVIRGWGINQDGRTNGITAPNPDAQRRLAAGVYRRFGIDPKRITMAEAHGTGTKLGDPIEVRALTEAFREFDAGTGYCALGSVKSNIGHLALAAGIAGLMKVLLSLRHRTIPPTLHCENVNEHIDLARSPFHVPRVAQAWRTLDDESRMACVSSFGFSGTNAHMVVEEAHAEDRRASSDDGARDRLVVLSARNPESLRASAARLRDALAAGIAIDDPPHLTDVAYTLQTGRAAFRHRLAIVAPSVAALIERLDAWLTRGADAGVGIHDGTAPASHAAERSASVAQALADGDAREAASLWVKGGDIGGDTRAFDGLSPRRIALPGYMFAKQRHWIGGATPAPAPHVDAPAAARHADAPAAGRSRKRIAVVGAGPAGLVMAKSLLEEGHQPDVFDRQADLGGVWLLHTQNKRAGAYRKTRFQTSKHTSAFSDFEGASTDGHFHGVADMHRYLRDYAEHFGVSKHIRYRTEVSRIEPHGEQWRVTTLRDGEARAEVYDGVALCQGLYWKPWRPAFDGLDTFRGQILHSAEYIDEACLKGKRVLVVGNGISGMDIAEEATKSASQVIWTMRKPKFIMPRMTGFVPNDFQSPASLLATVDPGQMLERLRYSMPEYFRQYQDSGLLPDLEDFRKQPLVQINDGVVPLVASGRVEAVVDEIGEFDASGCRFRHSGRRVDVDVVVFCTGYTMDEQLDCLPGVSMRSDFAMGIFHRDRPSLVSTSCPLPVAYSGTFFFPEMAARWYSRMMSGNTELARSERDYRFDRRHAAINGPIANVMFGLRLGLLPDPAREFRAFWELVNLPSFPPIYRLRGDHADPNAAARLKALNRRNLTSAKSSAALDTVRYRMLAGLGDAALRDLVARGEIDEDDYRNAGRHVADAITLDWKLQYILRTDVAEPAQPERVPQLPDRKLRPGSPEWNSYRTLLARLKAGELDMQGVLSALAEQGELT
ncbi:SDR family NAD(P)-dependent oxidoreductase [Xanthomonas sp. WHRI 10064A]|uniref:SDR family NAD(P)-dependent oxidoreductase n=1 Tax=unclassified Xanthomonas TaxID=2643310 RepID=UPI002B229BC5|nr:MULTISPECIES: SDR family NAD(P)-dependent oxidoreductase [unclassified Xanthomonas]MEA9588538.1 SDR family NAD(P)-dependent oxidoreductase [Xanthomonas sp. WHRI 10064B]MEA9613523.1 SDR family NAD(P)-dependent oxidoreductase [Xanthomonas sp. WHRI 10064A]